MTSTADDCREHLSEPCSCQAASGECVDAEMGKSLVLYQTGAMSPEEEHCFESHLLECDACFDILRGLDDAMESTLQALLEKRTPRSADSESRPDRTPTEPSHRN